MEKQSVTKEQAIKDLVKLFEINENTKSRINEENGSLPEGENDENENR